MPLLNHFNEAPLPARRFFEPVLLVVLVVPWLWGWTPGPSPNVVPLLISWVCSAVALAILVSLGPESGSVRRSIPAAWLLAACVNSVIALCQWFGLSSDLPLVSDSQTGQAFGNLRQRNHFATLTSLGLLSALWIRARQGGRLDYVVVVLLAFGNAASVSRTGLLQWLLIGVLIAAWPSVVRQQLWKVWVVALAAYMVAALALPELLFRLSEVSATGLFTRMSADLGCSSRTILWSNVLHLIAQKPWAGWGAGALDYAHYATLFPGGRFCDILDNAHNLPLHLAVEFGIPIAAVACSLMLWLVVRQRPWADRDPDRQLAWAVLAVLTIHSLLEYPLWYGPFQLAALMAIWLLLKPSTRPIAPVYTVLPLAFVTAGLAFALYEYYLVTQAYVAPEERPAALRENPVLKAGNPVFFRDQLLFAELAVTPLSRATAPRLNELAARMLYHSPEPKVIEKLIESSLMLGRDEEAQWHAARYRIAFPGAYRAWDPQRLGTPGFAAGRAEHP